MLGGVGIPQYQEYANDIHNSGGHLLEIINEILDLSKIEARRFDLSISEVDLHDAMSTVEKLIEGRVGAKDVSLKIDFSPTLPLLLSDEKAFRQMLLNLLSNALKFTSEGGTISVSSSLGADGGVQVEVGDSGIGISKEDIQKVMQPFGQVDSPLVRAMIDLHGGTLGLQSTVGVGTRVTLHFSADRLVPAHKAS
jgi:signal transduction histidine kinase